MNGRTALISSALLLAVLGWACEQQGPSSPSALGRRVTLAAGVGTGLGPVLSSQNGSLGLEGKNA